MERDMGVRYLKKSRLVHFSLQQNDAACLHRGNESSDPHSKPH